MTRLDPAGAALLYSTYFGGSGGDSAYELALDAAGAATICGETTWFTLPTTPGVFQPNSGGGDDAFVARLDLTAPGQCNSGAASSGVSGAGLGACGPVLVSINSGGFLTLNWVGPPGEAVVLFAGPANAANANLGCIGILDIGTPPTYSDLILLIDGTLPSTPFFVIGPGGTAQQTFPLPVLQPGMLTTIQGVVYQPPGSCSFVLTAAFSLFVN